MANTELKLAGSSSATNVTLQNQDDGALRVFKDSTEILKVNPSGGVSGSVVQVVTYTTGAVATGTTIIPNDDTIPQNTEGDQYMTVTITPKSASNTLRVTVHAMVSSTSAGVMYGALFQDSTANALAVCWSNIYASGQTAKLSIDHFLTAGSTSATTFKFRAGSYGAGTTTFNGSAGGRLMGGVANSRMTVEEIAA